MSRRKTKIPERITPAELTNRGVKSILDQVRRADGYYVTITERDLSQSDYKNRVMPHTQILVSGGEERRRIFLDRNNRGRSVHVACSASR